MAPLLLQRHKYIPPHFRDSRLHIAPHIHAYRHTRMPISDIRLRMQDLAAPNLAAAFGGPKRISDEIQLLVDITPGSSSSSSSVNTRLNPLTELHTAAARLILGIQLAELVSGKLDLGACTRSQRFEPRFLVVIHKPVQGEEAARRHGLGRRLVDDAMQDARTSIRVAVEQSRSALRHAVHQVARWIREPHGHSNEARQRVEDAVVEPEVRVEAREVCDCDAEKVHAIQKGEFQVQLADSVAQGSVAREMGVGEREVAVGFCEELRCGVVGERVGFEQLEVFA